MESNNIGQLFSFLDNLDDVLWSYFGLPLIVFLGAYLSYKSRFVQCRNFLNIVKTFIGFLKSRDSETQGVHPIKAFFACVGGCIGIGNVVAICTAAQIGGPGALLWMWITALLGSLIKYSEVCLGVRYRVPNARGSFDGGPMYFLPKAYKNGWIGKVACIFLCIYGVEVYQFSVITTSITSNLGYNKLAVVCILLVLVVIAGQGGVKRVGTISSAIIPIFLVLYLSMGMWVLFMNRALLPELFASIFTSAFSGHAAIGAFAGSSILMTVAMGSSADSGTSYR